MKKGFSKMKTKSEKNNVIECFEANNKMKELIFFNISPSSLKSTKILKEKKEKNCQFQTRENLRVKKMS